MEPNTGELYHVQQPIQQQPGMKLSKSNSRLRMEERIPQRMTIATEEFPPQQHRRGPTHVAEARYHDTEF